MTILFWVSLFVIFYTFLGYGILLYGLVLPKRLLKKIKTQAVDIQNLPTVTLIVAAYNEEQIISKKIDNTLALIYPKNKITFLFVTDGSSDTTPDIIAANSNIQLMHSSMRKGKINAIHRSMNQVKSEIVVFTDANTFLNNDAVLNICRHYSDIKIGAVSGEKRVQVQSISDATAGEGFYWKYESKLKAWDSELNSIVGAAGELFSIRTALYEAVPPDTILDDFMISMHIAEKGYRIVYEPKAYAVETSSENVDEELKRKIRIAAGGMQSILRLPGLFNIFKNPLLSFQYISHRVLRWTITPFLLIIAFLSNALIVINHNRSVYTYIFTMQIIFYALALLGKITEHNNIKVKVFFIPYYFCIMNYAVIAGIKRYFFKEQSAIWDKAKRK